MQKKIVAFLKELEKTIDVYWNIGHTVGQFLNLLILDQNFKNILEIGTSNGYSGIWLAEAVSKTKGHLYTIESHKKHRFKLAAENFAESGLAKYITQILGHAPEAIPKSPKYFDLILLDATKYEYPDYLKAVLPRTKKGSIIIADNINTHKNALKPYIRAINSQKNFINFSFNIGNGILLSLRVK